ncbi:MAG: hypothetical protein GF346_03685, partial [Candidatus Eisenbacteria bacterium]|nr:hypothetical protein [Candidatus Latescibacterota bacterium]MBD3301525.1 hypothetical protein [Candidatus Eisenbacteria bacterium]
MEPSQRRAGGDRRQVPRPRGGLRVLLVLHRAGRGGTERHVLWLGRGLAARGHEVAVALSHGGPLLSDLHAAGLAVHRIERRGSLDSLY